MSIVRISSTKPTPEERKALELREKKYDEAVKALNAAILNLKAAHQLHAQAKREYKRALNELVTYR